MKLKTLKFLGVCLFVSLFLLFYYWPWQKKTNSNLEPPVSLSIQVPQTNSPSYRYQSISPALTYRIGIVTQNTNLITPCRLFASKTDGTPLDTPTFPEFNNCEFSNNGNLKSPKIEWASNETLLIEKNPGWVEIYQINSSAVKINTYDSKLYQLINIISTESPTLVLQPKDSLNSNSFLFQSSNKSIRKFSLALTSDYEIIKILPSKENNGLIFYTKKVVEEMAAIDIYFVSIQTNKQTKIFSTPLSPMTPVGCGEFVFIDLPQKPLLSPGCFDISEKLLNSEGQLELQLY